MSQAQFFLNRPLGGGRPVPPTRVKRRRTHFSTLLGIETFPGATRCGAGTEVQLRARHSYFSFMKAWLVSLVSLRGRCWPIGILVLYLCYLVGIVSLLKYTTDVEEDTETIFDDISIPVTELGVALFFLLGFRTNNSYQHWRQGRMQWSMLQSRSLNMARECCTYIDDMQMRKRVLKWNMALITSMKAHLRETRDIAELLDEGVLTADEIEELQAEPDMVVACFIKLSECVYTTMQEKLTGQPQLILQMARDNLRQMSEDFFLADGIRVTPLPYAYVVHLRFFLVIWLLALPVSYTGKFGWWTVMASFIIGVALLGFDSIATKIENPYGNGFNDIPMDAIVQRSKDIAMYLMKTRTGENRKENTASESK
ncbi:hypothetical protein BSKO_06277 [Bryopsis sp. KO-2023]|nr:hypothetical protein BSKO_06277 [Bryopsis sp. KO-2023]